MININGTLYNENEAHFLSTNRALKYGDALFETIKVVSGKVVFAEDHYFRLMASMHQLRMEVPMHFDLEFFEHEILKVVHVKKIQDKARVRVTVFRKNGGLFNPITNDVDYFIEATSLVIKDKTDYRLDLFKDYFVQVSLLSTLKTTNRILNVLGSIFAAENDFDNCILLNDQKSVVEVLNGNIFIIKDKHIKTPRIEDGCIQGIYRKKLIEAIQNNDEFTIEEVSISPFEIQKSDGVFITNAILGVQAVSHYKKKQFNTAYAIKLAKLLEGKS